MDKRIGRVNYATTSMKVKQTTVKTLLTYLNEERSKGDIINDISRLFFPSLNSTLKNSKTIQSWYKPHLQ